MLESSPVQSTKKKKKKEKKCSKSWIRKFEAVIKIDPLSKGDRLRNL